ncbi:hypothetical protein Tco_1349509 [Tanacetum coccineum]
MYRFQTTFWSFYISLVTLLNPSPGPIFRCDPIWGCYIDQPQDDSEPKTNRTPRNNWFTQPPRPPTPDLEWNKGKVVDDSQEHIWFNDLLYAEKGPLTFNELIATPIDFYKFEMNRLKIDKRTKAHLVGPDYNLLKGICQSSIELEYNIEEYYKALSPTRLEQP